METIKKLVTVTNNDIINDLRENKFIELLYPLKSFCVGYDLEFDIDEIDGFILVNRLLDDNELEKLKKILDNVNIKGIVFDDLGIIEIVANLKMQKILLLDHLATNAKSINYYLEYVDSVVVSNDLTEDEISYIVENATKKLVINVFGLKTLMYSRRKLLSNYENYYNLENETLINAKIEEKYFKIMENDFGTKFYAGKYYNGLNLLKLNNVLYFWYDPILLDKQNILEVVLNSNIKNIKTDTLFLDKKTYYKVGEN